MKGSIETLTAENFDEELASFEGLAVVKFWAPWCRTCKAIGPKYETVAFQHLEEVQANRVRFYQVNVRHVASLGSFARR
jgi:thioredoxin 1